MNYQNSDKKAQEHARQQQNNLLNRANLQSGLGVDKPMTAMDDHSRSLEASLNSLERVQLQLDNLLDRMRGPQPRNEGLDKVPHETSSIISRLAESDNKLRMLCDSLNNQVDELGNLI